MTALSVFAALALTRLILRYVTSVYRFLGKTGALVIARVMALLIAAIAIQCVLFGVTHFLENMS